MTTKYYFHTTAPVGYYVTGARSTDTDSFPTEPASKYTPLCMNTWGGGTQASGAGGYSSASSPLYSLGRIFVGPFLSGNQTITGGAAGYQVGVAIGESSAQMNLYHRTFAYVYRSGTGNAKTLIGPVSDATEHGTGEVGCVIYATGAATNFTTSGNDRIIVEEWFDIRNTKATTYQATFFYNGTVDVIEATATTNAGSFIVLPTTFADTNTSQTLSQNATLKTATSQTLSQNSTLKTLTSQTLSQNAFLKAPSVTTTQTINQNATLKTVTSRTLSENATLKTLTSQTLSQNAFLDTTTLQTISQNATLKTVTTKTLSQNSTLKTITPQTILQNATLKTITTRTIDQNAALKSAVLSTSQTIQQNATLKTLTSQTLDQNAWLTEPGTVTVEPDTGGYAWWRHRKKKFYYPPIPFKQTFQIRGEISNPYTSQLTLTFWFSNQQLTKLKAYGEVSNTYRQTLTLRGETSNPYRQTLTLTGQVSNRYLRKLDLKGLVNMDDEDNLALLSFLYLLDEDEEGDLNG